MKKIAKNEQIITHKLSTLFSTLALGQQRKITTSSMSPQNCSVIS